MRRLSILLVYIAIVAVACGGDPERDDGGSYKPPPPPDLASTYTELFDALQDRELDPADGGTLRQPFLSVSGRVVATSYGDIQVFEYADAAAMEDEAATISEDGATIGNTVIGWVDVPHLFKHGRIIAITVGRDSTLSNALRGAMGPEFAGG